jgi:hypothetical protein
MSVRDLPDEQLVRLALEAIGDGAPERLRPLLGQEIEIRTARGRHRGIDAALTWAGKGYDHIQRRFELDRLEPIGDGLLGTGRVEYVWLESGKLGDSSPAFMAIRRSEGMLTGLSLHDDRQSAAAELGG